MQRQKTKLSIRPRAIQRRLQLFKRTTTEDSNQKWHSHRMLEHISKNKILVFKINQMQSMVNYLKVTNHNQSLAKTKIMRDVYTKHLISENLKPLRQREKILSSTKATNRMMTAFKLVQLEDNNSLPKYQHSIEEPPLNSKTTLFSMPVAPLKTFEILAKEITDLPEDIFPNQDSLPPIGTKILP